MSLTGAEYRVPSTEILMSARPEGAMILFG